MTLFFEPIYLPEDDLPKNELVLTNPPGQPDLDVTFDLVAKLKKDAEEEAFQIALEESAQEYEADMAVIGLTNLMEDILRYENETFGFKKKVDPWMKGIRDHLIRKHDAFDEFPGRCSRFEYHDAVMCMPQKLPPQDRGPLSDLSPE